MLKLVRSVLSAIALVAMGVPSVADSFPERFITIIVPFAAGGPADVYSRIIAQKLSIALKRSVVIENRPGAGSIDRPPVSGPIGMLV